MMADRWVNCKAEPANPIPMICMYSPQRSGCSGSVLRDRLDIQESFLSRTLHVIANESAMLEMLIRPSQTYIVAPERREIDQSDL